MSLAVRAPGGPVHVRWENFTRSSAVHLRVTGLAVGAASTNPVVSSRSTALPSIAVKYSYNKPAVPVPMVPAVPVATRAG